MQYFIHCNQKAVVDNKLNLDFNDLAIFDFMQKFSTSKRCVKKIVGDETYFWFSHKLIQNELPILGINSRSGMFKRIQKLVAAQLIKRCSDNKEAGESWFKFDKNADLMNFDDKENENNNSNKKDDLFPKVDSPVSKSTQTPVSKSGHNHNTNNNKEINNNNIAQNKFERLSLSDSNSLAEIKETNSTAKQKKSYAGDFETFCEAYPNKLGKSKSETKFAAAVKKIGFEKLLQCVENYKQFVAEERKKNFPNLAYKHLATFLNGSYEDFLPNIEKQQEIDNSPKYKGISLAATVKVVIQGGASSDVEFGKFLANCVRYQNNLHNYTYNGSNRIALNEIAEIKELLQNTKYLT
jgi:hypothetical protein